MKRAQEVHPSSLAAGPLVLTRAALQGLTLLLGLAATGAAARMLPIPEFGVYALLASAFAMMAPFADLGTQQLLVRARARTGRAAPVGDALSLLALRQALAVTATGVVLILGLYFGPTALVPVVALSMGVLGSSFVGTAWAYLASGDRPWTAFLLEIVPKAVSSTLILAAWGMGVIPGLAGISLMAFAVALPVGAAAAALTVGQSFITSVRHLPRPRAATAMAGRYAVVVLLSAVHYRIDIFLAGFILGPALAGTYGLAYRPFDLIVTSAQLLALPAFLVLVRPDRVRDLSSTSSLVATMFLAGVWLSALVATTAPIVIALLGGASYASSGPLLVTLAAAVPAVYATAILGYLHLAADREADLLRIVLICTILNVLGNVVLLPVLGIFAAALMTVTTEWLGAILLMSSLRVRLGWLKIGFTALCSYGWGAASARWAWDAGLSRGVIALSIGIVGSLVLARQWQSDLRATLRFARP